jgi:hypothetical protein
MEELLETTTTTNAKDTMYNFKVEKKKPKNFSTVFCLTCTTTTNIFVVLTVHKLTCNT